MGTILFMLALLVLPYVALSWLDRSGRVKTTPSRRGLIGLALLFVFTGIGHFIETQPMAAMLPPAIPFRVAIIYATGVVELALAAALVNRSTSRLASWCVIGFLALALPANIYAALERVPMGAHALGPVYLLARVPLQLIIGWWAYHFGVRQRDVEEPFGEPAATR